MVGITRSIPTLLMAWASGPWSCPNHKTFCRRKMNCKTQNIFPQTAPTNSSQKLIVHRKSVGWMLWASIEWWLLGRLEKKNTRSKGDWGGPPKNPPMLKLVSLLNSKVSTFQGLCKNLIWFDMGEPLYREPWNGYLFSNFPNICGS